jgi:aryl-alcohol dehydrogenase-like predicted oxidoreductase
MTNRRQILTALGGTTLAATLPLGAAAAKSAAKPAPVIPKRTLGRTGAMVTPLALGGQAALQWTPPGTDAPDIIVRAVQLGLNYLDSANVYGPSQVNYGEAFRRINLAPGRPNYDAALREKLYIASKTNKRFARDPSQPAGATLAIDDLKRSMTQMFGDGQGAVPDGAYLDAIQIHALGKVEDIDTLYLGMKERGGRMPEKIGAFAALIDYRDGTNYTGLNPQHKRWVRHVGVTGHLSSPILMKMLRLDENHDLDQLLVALNVNDKLYQPHQYNVLPLAVARGMGVIAMKVFADGVFFGKEARFSRNPDDVNTKVGNAKISTHDMVRYTLSLPGVCCAIIGTGHIDRADASKDQMVANLAAAIDTPMTADERAALETAAAEKYGATTNYFQEPAKGLIQPTDVKVTKDGGRVLVSWQAGYAGARPIQSYQIKAGGKTVLTIPARVQLGMAPLTAWLTNETLPDGAIEVVASETI